MTPITLIRDSDNTGFRDTILHTVQNVAVGKRIPLNIPKGFYLAISQILFGAEYHGTQGEINNEVNTLDCIMTRDLGGTKGISAHGVIARKGLQTYFKTLEKDVSALGWEAVTTNGINHAYTERQLDSVNGFAVVGYQSLNREFTPPIFLHHTQKCLWRYAKVTTQATIAAFSSMEMTVWIRGFLTTLQDITRIYGIR